MILKTFQIFRAGTHTAMSGRAITFTPGDVANMAACYSEGVRSAPLVLGHPANDSPAIGTVKKLFEKAGNLYAIADVSKPLIDLVRRGAYRNISAAFHPFQDAGRWYLRHVGFLGAVAPAVKGMAELNFSEHGGMCFAEPCAISFAEIDRALSERSSESGRVALHNAATALKQRNPSLSYAAAVHAIESRERPLNAPLKPTTRRHARDGFHEAALCFQEAVPGASYQDAVIQIEAAGMRL